MQPAGRGHRSCREHDSRHHFLRRTGGDLLSSTKATGSLAAKSRRAPLQSNRTAQRAEIWPVEGLPTPRHFCFGRALATAHSQRLHVVCCVFGGVSGPETGSRLKKKCPTTRCGDVDKYALRQVVDGLTAAKCGGNALGTVWADMKCRALRQSLCGRTSRDDPQR